MELKIYNQTGDLKLTVSPNTSSTVTEEVMGECAVSVGFTHTEFVMLDVNDYIDIEGVRYMIMAQYRPKQKNTQTYEYSVKFYAPIHQAENTLMLFTPDNEMTSEFAYDGGPREHLQLWIDNMNRIAGTDVWKIGTVISADNKVIEYKNVKCWDAAFGSNGIAAAFNTEMWADGYYINLCKAERGERVDLGYLQGLTSLQQEENGEVKFFTRLFPLGSTRNIDASKYGHARLQLPDGVQYVDKNVDIYGVKEEFEEEAFSEIYPKYIGTVQSVRTENLTNTEGRDYTVYYIKDAAISFNPNDYEIAEYTKMIAFQSGELAGRGDDKGSFQANWHEDTKEWEIINTYPDDDTQIPGGLIVPKAGDTYIPWNFRMPDSYTEAAELEYLAAVNNYLDEYSFDTNKYSGQTDRNHIENNNIKLMIGLNVRLQSDTYFAAGYKDTRITKVVRQLNDLYQATVTCTDKIGDGWKKSVDNSINNIKYALAKQDELSIDVIKTTDSKTPSDNNVFSALMALKTLLRKDRVDQTNFLLKFGEFIDSMIAGKGAGIYPDGTAQFERVGIRGALIVKELIFNRWFAQEGNVTYSEAGTVERIELLDDGTYDLYLRRRWDNDITAFAENDVCFGSVNNLLSTGEYYDSWFRVLNVMQAENKLNVVLYPDAEVPGGVNHAPEPLMVITRRGNPVNTDRQGFWYISSYEGCICFLDGVTKPIIEENNYAVIIGKLKRLEIFTNLPINYLHSYVYCRGIATQDLFQIRYDGVVVRKENPRGFWSLEVAQSDKPYTQTNEYYDSVSHYGCEWMCLVTGTIDEPKYGSTGWAMIRGNPAFTIDIDSTQGWQFDFDRITDKDDSGDYIVFTTLQVTGQLYNQDVTDDILDSDVTWARDTGNVTEDNAWAIKRADAGKTLSLTLEDLGTDYMSRSSCSFKATALLRDGQQYEIAENYVTF